MCWRRPFVKSRLKSKKYSAKHCIHSQSVCSHAHDSRICDDDYYRQQGNDNDIDYRPLRPLNGSDDPHFLTAGLFYPNKPFHIDDWFTFFALPYLFLFARVCERTEIDCRDGKKKQEENILDSPAAVHSFHDIRVLILGGLIDGL